MGLPWWFNTIGNLFSVIGGAAVAMFGINFGLRQYFDWRVRMEETHNIHTKVVIDLIDKNEQKYQVLRKEIEDLGNDQEKENERLHERCESIQAHIVDFRKDTLEMIKIALKIK
jgi:hypothetical protein